LLERDWVERNGDEWGYEMGLKHRHGVGFLRREFIQVGFSGLLGLGMSRLVERRGLGGEGYRASGGRVQGRARSVIIVFFTGGLSHHETFDMKPEAPERIRGSFRPIATSTSGIWIGEHLPMLASRMDRLAIVRTFSHGNLNHLNSTHMMLTGQNQPGAFFDKIASRDDYPCYAGAGSTCLLF